VIRLVLGLLGNLLLAAAFATAVIDGKRSVEADALVVTSFAEAAGAVTGMTAGAFEAVVKGRVPGFLWDPLALTLLRLPAVLVVATIALILFRLSRLRAQKLRFETP
jgi:ABC-type antimicrobial peptide transport system permease subunit